MVVLSVDQNNFLANCLHRRSTLQLASFKASIAHDVAFDSKTTKNVLFMDQPSESVVDEGDIIFCK